MQRSKIAIVFFFVFNATFAQEKVLLEKLNQFYFTFLPEYIDGHLSQSEIQPGKSLWFSLYVNSASKAEHNSSTVAYVELRNSSGEAVHRQKLRIKENVTSGAIELPSTFPDGNYSFVAYTLWMKNLGEWSYFKRSVFVGKKNEQVAPHQWSLPTSNTLNTTIVDGSINVKLDTAIDGLLLAHYRGRVIANVSLTNTQTNKELNISTRDIKEGDIAIGVFSMTGTLLRSALIRIPPRKRSDVNLIINRNGAFEPGNKMEVEVNNETSAGEDGQTGFMSISISRLPGAQIEESNFRGTATWDEIVSTRVSITYPREMLTYPNSPGSIDPLPLKITSTPNTTVTTSQSQTFEKFFSARDSVARTAFLEFASDNTYRPSDYLSLPTLEDFIKEVVPQAKIKSEKGVKNVYLRNIENSQHIFFYKKPPLLLVNNQIIENPSAFFSISPSKIEKIDVVWQTSTINHVGIAGLANGGIIAVYTSDRKPIGEGAFIYQGFEPEKNFQLRQLKKKVQDRLPDFRDLVYWSAEVPLSGNKFTVPLSDDLGEFLITILGRDETGGMFEVQRMYKVDLR